MSLELLSPAGSPESLTAAVQAGADAVYLGFGPFNARRNAKNFSLSGLRDAAAYCHLRGAKVYLTLNTLVSDRELPLAAETAAQAVEAGVDAILVQDLGVARLLRDACPDVPLHASTQMTVHSLDGIKACADLGMSRVVLARELSRSAIADLCARSPLEIEVFVHGALCMCYSGQCHLSAVLGGRSGNRGLCAQPCRLAFRWPGDRRDSRPLSLKDLSLAGHLRELEDMGVACLKIEGRMKRPEYVSVVTGIYAAALRENREPTAEELRQLEAAFSRQGFTQGYYLDRKGSAMFGSRPETARDPEELFRRARQSYSRGEHRLTPVSFSARIRRGQPVSVAAEDPQGRRAVVKGPVPEPARSRPLTEDAVTAQLRKTGGTVYEAAEVRAEIDAGLSLPLSEVNALRRAALSGLDAARTAVPPRRFLPWSPPERKTPGPASPPELSLSFRRWDQLTAACLEQGPALVYLPVEEAEAHHDALTGLTAAWPEIRFGVILPRVSWDRELPPLERALETARAAGVTEALLGHVGQLPLARSHGFTLRADFGLGLFNSLTAGELARLGFASATVSFEARLAQIRDLDKPLPLEMPVYGRLPLMLMENCILKNRGQGCHCRDLDQSLQDRKGASFPVEAAWGCRSELFNARVLWLADKTADWTAAGVAYARLAFLREEPGTCAQVVRAYRAGGGTPPEAFTRGLYYRGVE